MKCVITRQIPFFSLISDHSSSTVIGASFGVGVIIGAVVGMLIWWALKRRNSRKENTRGDYGIRRIIRENLISAQYHYDKRTVKRVLN